MKALKAVSLSFVLALAACSGGEPAAPNGDAVNSEDPPTTETEAKDLELTADQLKEGAEYITLVPSPVETQKAMEASGIDKQLADLIVKRDYDLNDKDIDDVAVRTGVVIANMLLTVKTASDEHLVSHLANIKHGLKLLSGGSDIDATISELVERVKGEAVTRDELLKELDELSGALIPELEFNGVKRVVPLIQAGSWLQGSNLVAKAIKEANKPESANELLKKPEVVDYFIKYVKTEGKEKAPAAVTDKLESSLQTLKGLASKTESFTSEDIDTVITVTDEVLTLL
jgi:hypothetical protein